MLKTAEEKTAFYQRLTNLVDTFPEVRLWAVGDVGRKRGRREYVRLLTLAPPPPRQHTFLGQDVCVHKILPTIRRELQTGQNKRQTTAAAEPSAGAPVRGAVLLPALLKIGAKLPPGRFGKEVTPAVEAMFASNDRATRVQLLSKLPDFVKLIDGSSLAGPIFTSVLSGFSCVWLGLVGMQPSTVCVCVCVDVWT